MASRRMEIICFLFCLCLCLTPCRAQAASTADAKESISIDKTCTLTLSYTCEGTALKDVPVKLYHIASVSAEGIYTLADSFEPSGLILNGIESSGEWDMIRSTLEAHMIANNINADFLKSTDSEGQVRFESLNPGLYLAISDSVVQDDLQCIFNPSLIALPGLNTDGFWQYQVTVSPKPEILPPLTPDDKEEETFKVLKLWKDDGHQEQRPERIEVEIFKDGTSFQTVTLSEDNHWSYTWTAKADNSEWMVAERNISAKYTATVEERTTTFILTNTLIPEETPPTENVPQTGDTTHIFLYTLLMYGSGIVLILLGIIRKRERL